MELRNLLTFSKIAELQSFSKAAELLGYAQSTVTMQIKQLEEEFGILLFDRIGKNIYLTDDGANFLRYANDMIVLSHKAKESISGRVAPRGKLRLGVVGSICSSVLPPIFVQYHEAYPLVEIIVKQATTLELVELLKVNKVDMILTLDEQFDHSEWIKAAQRREKIVFFCASGHPFAGRSVTIQELLAEKFILTEEGCNYRYIFEKLLAADHKKVKPYLEIGNTAIIQEFIASGDSISLLPQITIEKNLRGGRLSTVTVENYHIEMWGQLFYHKNKWITPAMREFIRLLKETLFFGAPA